MDVPNPYDAPRNPQVLSLQPTTYIVIASNVSPGSQELLHALEVLDALSDLVKAGWPHLDDYPRDELFPLEGVWEGDGPVTSSDFEEHLIGRIMMRQPDVLASAQFDEHKRRLSSTIDESLRVFLDDARLETVDEGLCVQMLHIGPYSNEPDSFALLNRFLQDHGLRRTSETTHREIYLADARTTPPASYETILRVQVAYASA